MQGKRLIELITKSFVNTHEQMENNHCKQEQKLLMEELVFNCVEKEIISSSLKFTYIWVQVYVIRLHLLVLNPIYVLTLVLALLFFKSHAHHHCYTFPNTEVSASKINLGGWHYFSQNILCMYHSFLRRIWVSSRTYICSTFNCILIGLQNGIFSHCQLSRFLRSKLS